MPKTIFSVVKFSKEMTTAFQEDCEQFLLEFEKLKSFKFQDFSEIWKEMGFTYVYGDFRYLCLIRILMENFFLIIKKFIMYPKNIFTQIGAIYLLYGLYYKQPIKNWISIRLTLEEYDCISKILLEMMKRKEMEPLFIFMKLKVDGAFIYVANREKLDLLNKNPNIFKNDIFQTEHIESSLIKYKRVHEATINDLEILCNDYKKSIEKFSVKSPTFEVISLDLIQELKGRYKSIDEFDKTNQNTSERNKRIEPGLSSSIKKSLSRQRRRSSQESID